MFWSYFMPQKNLYLIERAFNWPKNVFQLLIKLTTREIRGDETLNEAKDMLKEILRV
jgi:hypothetical protein